MTEFPFLQQRLSIGRLNTPIDYLPRLSRRYGVELYAKRDDLTGLGLSGNKIRKLEYLFHHAAANNADTFITCGGVQSNHARATAVLCRKLGYLPVLVLYGSEPPRPYDGNLLLDELLEADVRFTSPEVMWDNNYLENIAEELRSQGRTPFVIPMGGSNDIGALGYFSAGLEIREQEKDMGVKFDKLFCAVGSGGTYAGLVFAQKMTGWNTEVCGVNVAADAGFFRNMVRNIAGDFNRRYGQNLRLTDSDLTIIDGFVGPGYAQCTPEVTDLIRLVAREEGLFLDPVYTGKAFWALHTLITQGEIPSGSKILFLHTGGIFGLFPQRKWLEQ